MQRILTPVTVDVWVWSVRFEMFSNRINMYRILTTNLMHSFDRLKHLVQNKLSAFMINDRRISPIVENTINIRRVVLKNTDSFELDSSRHD